MGGRRRQRLRASGRCQLLLPALLWAPCPQDAKLSHLPAVSVDPSDCFGLGWPPKVPGTA